MNTMTAPGTDVTEVTGVAAPQIAVLDRGFIYIGYCCFDGDGDGYGYGYGYGDGDGDGYGDGYGW